ncbi:ATP-binding cassette domain-containing protein [Loktanella sp. IMCC34160]|uniref:ATP-binding cassette domain-containing protein n=1 Tax=Loktanella sp. IMCC34160 TaxID=2510646 RepID=UPI00101B6F2A|nr:ATP-binding cassette domain-containing protein [Loktanella sp. IMCC34160]RYG91425.1 ATP-binding cassette domain-containing protein [Loktanella sp. IMCC34160]
MDSGLVLRDFQIWLEQSLLLEISADVPCGQVLTIMGPSGSGKSTLLAGLTGTLQAPFSCSGLIQLNGADISRRPTNRRGIGILFQDDLLFPHMSVGANLAFGLRPGGSRAERLALVSSALAEVGLEGMEDRDPASLSGGQRARVSLMRMLLAEPSALVLDEPFSRLDSTLRERTRSMVFGLANKRGLPVVLVTHDREDAAAANGQVIELSGDRAELRMTDQNS